MHVYTYFWQAMNKETALRLLKSKLLAIAQEQKAREIKDIKGELVTADFGSQVRNYVPKLSN